MSEENKAVVRRWLEDGMNGRDLAIIDECFAPDYANHSPRLGVVGREYTARETAEFFIGFPDWQTTIDDVVAEGEKVVVRRTVQGTYKGEVQGAPVPQPGNWSFSQYGRCFASLTGR